MNLFGQEVMQSKIPSLRTIMRSEKIWLSIGLMGMLMISNAFPQQHSTLWGVNGEKWDPEILPDFSKAGYQEGMKPIPEYPVSVNVKNYGAVGDGNTDNTAAFRKAIAAAKAFTSVYIPDGVYVIKDTIHIGKSISLRGQSRDQTVLYFPIELEELYPQPYEGRIHMGVQVSRHAYGRMAFLMMMGGEEKGVETLTLKFPNVKWRGHHLEQGYNGILMTNEKNGWVKNVRIVNTDYGMKIALSNNITVSGILFQGESNRSGKSGHHGVYLNQESFNCLVENVEFDIELAHQLSISSGAHHNVFSNCRGENMHMDHHLNKGMIPMSTNLWTNIDVGSGQNAWGNNAQGSEPENKATSFKGLTGSTFGEVYWNIRSTQPIFAPLGMSNIAVGLNTNDKTSFKWDAVTYKHIHEKIDPATLQPQNLYEAQLAYKKKNTVVLASKKRFQTSAHQVINHRRNSIQVILPSTTDKLFIRDLQGKMLYEIPFSKASGFLLE